MRLLSSLTFALLCLFALPATAAEPQASDDNPRVYIWGIKQGCSQSSQRAEAVRRYLRSIAYPATVLKVPPEWQGCQGEECARLLSGRCPGPGRGVLLGGRVEEKNKVVRVRLWMYDYAARKTAYQDGFCNKCDLDESLTLSTAEIIERPSFESTPSATPIYCKPVTEVKEPPPPYNKVFFLALGDGKQKQLYQPLLEEVARKSGIRAEPVTQHIKSLSLDALNRIVAREGSARVLWTELTSDGKVYVWIFDQHSQMTDGLIVDCAGCDKDALLAKTRAAAEQLLDRCLGPHCSNSASPMRRPPEACEPYLACGGTELASATDAAAPSGSLGIDPKLARLVKGSLWGLVGATAASSLLLLALDQTAAGTFRQDGREVTHVLAPASIGLAAASGLALGLAIPVTLLVNRAAPRSRSEASPSDFQCPQ